MPDVMKNEAKGRAFEEKGSNEGLETCPVEMCHWPRRRRRITSRYFSQPVQQAMEL